MRTLEQRWRVAIGALKGARGVTDEQIADVLGKDRTSVSRKINGSREWTLAELQRLKDVYGEDAEGVVEDLLATLANRQYHRHQGSSVLADGHVA